jgi:hypothetical protein
MNAAIQLAGVRRLRDSVHKNSNRAHGREEESVAISPRGSIRLEKEQKQPGTRRGGENSRRDLVLVENEARARVERLKCERKPTGWIWELYRGFVSRKRQENPGIESVGERIRS